ncbi:hypothetical protein OnM2_036006 [Erysiphe neolycopersici]|uniref:Uncharacterized protein n=1 Tax=Erysiphe neolycopersici TaxID=212602 RepID=A0A420HX59_9PEZI|nr:hypothetical protein OnM2_036006 [Erysiphe neolycopersici]
MTTIFKTHIASSLSSPTMHFSSSPPATPSTTLIAKGNFRRDFVMSSPSNNNSRSFASLTPRTCRLANIYTTPSSGSRKDLAIITTPSTSHFSRSKVKFSARQTKPNPLVPSRESYCIDEERATRRILFLNRVKEAGEEKRWRKRNGGFGEGDEEIMRALWLTEKKNWQEQQRREASGQLFPEEYEELDETQCVDKDSTRLEDFLDEEDLNLSDFYLAQDAEQAANSIPTKSQKLYTCDDDDDEYDHIFMEVIQQENETSNSSIGYNINSKEHDEMDMS